MRISVEETIHGLLDEEAKALTNAERYERTAEPQGYRAGHYERDFQTTSGNVTLKMPKLKGIAFETAIIERYQRRESSVEEALIEMYLAGGIRPESGGYYRGAVGQQGVPRYDQQSEQKDLRPYRRMAAASMPLVTDSALYTPSMMGTNFFASSIELAMF